MGKDGGGSLKFLGRIISRQSGSPTLVVQVDSSYMDGACEEFGIRVPKGVVGPLDIKPSLEATVEESPISPEAHSRYRRVLGRLACLAQTRIAAKVLHTPHYEAMGTVWSSYISCTSFLIQLGMQHVCLHEGVQQCVCYLENYLPT